MRNPNERKVLHQCNSGAIARSTVHRGSKHVKTESEMYWTKKVLRSQSRAIGDRLNLMICNTRRQRSRKSE